eukprot:TRINITY_DN3243_c0_g1_i2.p1 TRINITY_DN3243_c0_g1~~TRINITY_DN3243_c0_g1_i2.p1  ORF type:complete len:303 (+),score=48.93 TRINITY_DN3243_c0_g1_i2:191-1099(+)
MFKNVLILGASGYIGSAVATALRNEGHKVYGLVRSAQAAEQLRAKEIIPVIALQQETEKWFAVAENADVVIDVIGKNDHSAVTLNNWALSSKSRVEKGKSKSLFIFTSGCMTYGSAGDRSPNLLTEEDQPVPHLQNPHGLARKEFEDTVLAASGIVVRPGWVYGNSGGTYNKFFFGQVDVENNTVKIRGRGDKRFSWININDLATAYALLIAKEASTVEGQLFNLNAREYPSYEEIILAAAKVAGIENVTVVREEITGAQFLEVDVRVDPSKAENLLGWKAKRRGFLEEIDLYYPAWKLAQK